MTDASSVIASGIFSSFFTEVFNNYYIAFYCHYIVFITSASLNITFTYDYYPRPRLNNNNIITFIYALKSKVKLCSSVFTYEQNAKIEILKTEMKRTLWQG